MPKKDTGNDVLQLFTDVQAAYTKVKEREEVRDAAAAQLTAATQDYNQAADALNELRAKLNDILGTVKDTRVRISS